MRRFSRPASVRSFPDSPRRSAASSRALSAAQLSASARRAAARVTRRASSAANSKGLGPPSASCPRRRFYGRPGAGVPASQTLSRSVALSITRAGEAAAAQGERRPCNRGALGEIHPGVHARTHAYTHTHRKRENGRLPAKGVVSETLSGSSPTRIRLGRRTLARGVARMGKTRGLRGGVGPSRFYAGGDRFYASADGQFGAGRSESRLEPADPSRTARRLRGRPGSEAAAEPGIGGSRVRWRRR